MSDPAFVQPKWYKPAPLGYGNAIDSVSAVASPLLAGFSLTSVIVVSDDSNNFRWPGAAALVLAIAAIILIGAVQCGYNARQYLWSGADALNWWPEMENDAELETLLREEQVDAFHRWEDWSKWTRRTYNYGIVALLGGLGLALPPPDATAGQGGLRWAATGVAFAACVGEVCWIVIFSRRRSAEAHKYGRES